MYRVIAVALIAVAAGMPEGAGPPPVAAQDMRTWDREAGALKGQHPAGYYKRAADLFRQGRQDDAVFLFYLGQLRYRVHLKARPELARDGDPALFASLSEVVGRPLNEYAFGDIPALAKTIEAVLTYDADHPDTFTPPGKFAAQTAFARKGLAEMRATMLADADQLRAQRLKNGLKNRN